MFQSKLKNLFSYFILFLATGFGVSFCACQISSCVRNFKGMSFPEKWTGAGLFGTVVGLLFVYWIFSFNGLSGLLLLVGITLLAVYVTGQAEKILGVTDDQRIVLDEIVGFFWASAFLPLHLFNDNWRWLILFAAFVLFRTFDVLKLPFRKAQNLKGGIGIVADDLFAGIFANLILQIGVRWLI